MTAAPMQHQTAAPMQHQKRAPLSVADITRPGALMCAIIISGGNLIFPRIPILLLLLLLAGATLALTPRRHERERFTPIFLLLGAVLLAGLARSGLADISATITRYANFLAAIMLLAMYLRIGRPAFVQDLCRILHPLAWIALLTVLLSTVVRPLFTPLEVQETIYYQLFFIFNYHVVLEDAGGLMRPNGIFYEPGVFQAYLSIYLYLSLFVLKNPRRTAIAALALFSTQSTTGIAVGCGLAAVYFWRQVGKGSLNRRVGMIAVAILLALLLSGPVIENVRSKFVGDLAGSSMARQFDLLTGINVIVNNPLFGIGFEPETYRQMAGTFAFQDTELDSHITEDRGNTNGVIVLLYSVGIPLALPFLFGLFRQTMLPDRLLVGGVIFVSMLSESLMLTPFFLLFQFSGLLLAPRTQPRNATEPVGPTAASLS